MGNAVASSIEVNNKALFNSCGKESNLRAVKQLLESNCVNIDYQSENGDTPLINAVVNDNLRIVKELLKHSELEINKQGRDGDTALICATKRGRLDIVKTLLKHKQMVVQKHQSPNSDNSSTLRLTNSSDFLELNVNKQNNGCETALIIASQTGNLQILQELLNCNDILVDAQNINGSTALTWACEKGYLFMVKELLKHKNIGINKQTINGDTAVMFASDKGHLRIVQELLKCTDIDIDIVNKTGQKAINFVSASKHPEVLQELQIFKKKESVSSKETNPKKEAKILHECSICLDNISDHCIDPCGHVCYCAFCANIQKNNKNLKCPICMTNGVKFLKIYV